MKKKMWLIFWINVFLSFLVLLFDCISFLKYQNSPEDVLLIFNFCLNVGTWSNFLLLISQTFNVYCVDYTKQDYLYILKKGVVSAGSICVGCIIFILVISLFLPLVDPEGSEFQSFVIHYESTKQYKNFFCLTPIIISGHYVLYYVVSLYFIFLNCLLWSIIGYSVYTVIKNAYISSILTFLVYYLEPYVIANIVNSLFHINLYTTKNFMLGNFNFQSSTIGNVTLLTALYFTMIFLLIKLSYFTREYITEQNRDLS